MFPYSHPWTFISIRSNAILILLNPYSVATVPFGTILHIAVVFLHKMVGMFLCRKKGTSRKALSTKVVC
jgi:hypothetical protein